MTTLAANGNSRGRIEEFTVSRFCVEIQEVVVAVFQECSGLSGEVEIETYKEGGQNAYVHKLAGRVSYGNLTLKSGVASAEALWKWFCAVAEGKIERRNVSIIMVSQNYTEGKRWNLEAAYPVKWSGPTFNASEANVTVHTLELAHNGIGYS